MNRLATLLLCLLPMVSAADERILSYHSDIVVQADGWIDVTETIKVRAEGNRIRRGIYRDFPTEYFDKLGNRYEVDFKPLAVLRNNQSEDFHTQSIRNGWRTYFGSSDRYVSNGEHTYMFRYRASRMLGFFEEHDELYWNVTGFNWAFPIDSASATVTFSFDIPANDITHEAYTGPFGSTAQNYTSSVDGSGRANFRANNSLSAVNGLTIVVGWPKGYIDEPTGMQRLLWLLKDNSNLLAALAGFVVLLAYYIPVWRNFGKDPEEGVIVARYHPPKNLSPASLRYIRQMYYDDKVMTAAIVNLAVKGYLRIDVSEAKSGFLGIGSEPGKHSLTDVFAGNADAPPLAAGERELYEELFSEGKTVVLENKNHKLLGSAKSAHKKSLSADYKNHYFKYNGALNIPAVFVAIITSIVSLSLGAGPNPLVIAVLIALFVTTVFFAVVMKRPTIRGRQLLDEMLGFKDYLEVAERDELNLRNPPEKTPQLFEAYLPYALALGVDQQWAQKFASVLASIGEPGRSSYHPAWYGGTWNVSNLGATTSHLSSSLNAAVTSSVTPPGSSSGGGGGGSSGGGGGGGGGGGW
jgi:uncharacterized membrane protein YgcG